MNHRNIIITPPPAHQDVMDDNDSDTTQKLIIVDDPLDIGSPDSVDHVFSTTEAVAGNSASPTPTTSNSTQPASSNTPNSYPEGEEGHTAQSTP
jgi:hypothetical protein